MLAKVSNLWSWQWDASNDGKNLSTTVLAVVVTVFAVLWWSRSLKKRKQASPPLPPGPRGLPIVGNLPFLGTELHKTFTELGKVYGPIYRLWLGSKLYVVVGSPSLAKEVVRDKDVVFAHRDQSIAALIFSYGGNDIAFSSYNTEWKNKRKIFASEVLSNSSLDASYELRKEEIKGAIRDVYKKCGSPVNVGDLAFSINANTAIRMLCGGSVRAENWTNFVVEFRKLTREIVFISGKLNVSDSFPMLASFDFQGIKKQMKRICQYLDTTIDSVIQQCLDSTNKKGEKKDILQILLDIHKLGETITMDQVKAMMLDVMFASTDTTTTTIEWTMAELMKHQEVMEKVQRELEEVVGMNNMVQEFHLPKLHYLGAVVKETMRLHPALPTLLPHAASQSCSLGGYNIPKGTLVLLNVYAMHRDPHLWSNPLEFKPERFQHGNFDYWGNNFQYLPFGSGRRVCAGIPLAEKMLIYVLASLLHSFDWKLPDGTDLEMAEKFGLVVQKLNPLMVIPTARLSNYELY